MAWVWDTAVVPVVFLGLVAHLQTRKRLALRESILRFHALLEMHAVPMKSSTYKVFALMIFRALVVVMVIPFPRQGLFRERIANRLIRVGHLGSSQVSVFLQGTLTCGA